MHERHKSPQRQAQAETNTSYCSSAPQFSVCSGLYFPLLSESDKSIRMIEGFFCLFVCFAEQLPVLRYNSKKTACLIKHAWM